MKLAAYLKKHNLSQKAFAERVGVTQGCVWQWVNGYAVSAKNAVEIERATNGEVDRSEVCNLFERKSA
jgi:DNA-binding transcriptional regulator YdaS (Cro superfamily)